MFGRPRRLHLPPLPIAAVWLVLILVNLSCIYYTVADMATNATASDWRTLTSAAEHGIRAGLYQGGLYQWSPLLVPVFQALAPIGVVGWRLLHVAAALAMPTWPLRLLVLASWPFWFDLNVANVLTFVVLAAAWALRGSTVAGVVFLVLTALIPRPLMLPVAAWLLWRRPSVRRPFLLLAVVMAAGTLLTGVSGEWLGTLLASASNTGPWTTGGAGWDFNIGPSRALGAWWVAIGLPLAVWLTRKGRLGLASLAASPYWLPYYLLFAVLELMPQPMLSRLSPDLARADRGAT